MAATRERAMTTLTRSSGSMKWSWSSSPRAIWIQGRDVARGQWPRAEAMGHDAQHHGDDDGLQRRDDTRIPVAELFDGEESEHHRGQPTRSEPPHERDRGPPQPRPEEGDAN